MRDNRQMYLSVLHMLHVLSSNRNGKISVFFCGFSQSTTTKHFEAIVSYYYFEAVEKRGKFNHTVDIYIFIMGEIIFNVYSSIQTWVLQMYPVFPISSQVNSNNKKNKTKQIELRSILLYFISVDIHVDI